VFPHHPFSYVGRAVQQFDVARFAAIEKSHDLDVDESHSLEVQSNASPITCQLRFKFIQKFCLQPTAQANDRLYPIGNSFAFQCHLGFCDSSVKIELQ